VADELVEIGGHAQWSSIMATYRIILFGSHLFKPFGGGLRTDIEQVQTSKKSFTFR